MEPVMEQSSPPLLKPLPRRPFLSSSPSPSSENPDQTPDSPISRSRSILNLTSSTLFGIYAPTTLTAENTDTPPTPWGTGAECPSPLPDRQSPPSGAELTRRLQGASNSSTKHRTTTAEERRRVDAYATRPSLAGLLLRGAVLFVFGVAYGAMVARLQDSRRIVARPASVVYLAGWGLAGLAMGNLFPWVDRLTRSKASALRSVEWQDVVRSIGAFVGVSFAIRKLQWETTLQLSLTLAMTNPFLWYLLDRTMAGLVLSTIIGSLGTLVLLVTNPDIIPAPTSDFTHGGDANRTAMVGGSSGGEGARNEYVGVATWIGSVLFCSCVCFGNIGRLLVSKSERNN